MSKELRENVYRELWDLFYNHDYNIEELAKYAVKRISTATLDDVESGVFNLEPLNKHGRMLDRNDVINIIDNLRGSDD